MLEAQIGLSKVKLIYIFSYCRYSYLFGISPGSSIKCMARSE
jgi:hypothetical protein